MGDEEDYAKGNLERFAMDERGFGRLELEDTKSGLTPEQQKRNEEGQAFLAKARAEAKRQLEEAGGDTSGPE